MAINDISLTSGMRTNLVSLQTTTELLNRTQDRLSSGKKVNTALDNALNFFTAKALNTRADELAGYKDGMSEAVQTIKAANAGISAIEGLIGQAKAVAATAKAGGTAGTGAVSNITVDLVGITDGQTIFVGGQTFTAVATDGRLQKTIDFTNIAVGNQIQIGNTTYTAIGLHDTIAIGDSLSVGATIAIGNATYTAVGTNESVSLVGIAVNDTITIGSTQYRAVGRYDTITIATGATSGMSAGDSITIGSTTFVASAGTAGSFLNIVYFDASSTEGADAVNLAAALTANGIGATAVMTSGIITLAATTSFDISKAGPAAGAITLHDRTRTTTDFIITTGANATNAATFAALATLNEGTSIGTAGANGIITLTGNTMATTVAASAAAIVKHTLGANEFTITKFTYSTTDANADSLATAAGISAATNGTITLLGNQMAGTVASVSSGIALVNHVAAATEFIISIGSDAANAATFFAQAGGATIGTYTAGTGDIKLSTTTSAATSTVTQNGGASIAAISTSTVSLTATEFYIGVGSTTLGATNNMSATNLAAKINVNSEGHETASVSGNRINILAGTLALTDANTPLELNTFDTVTSAATSATAGFTITYNKSTTDRTTYAAQFNTIMAQLSFLATDSSYKGINFLETGSTLDVIFGTSSSDKITLTGFDASASGLLAKSDTAFLATAQNTWATNADVNTDIEALARATATLKAQSSSMSSGLSIINTRQDFVKAMVNTVTQGADNLTLADMNEEGANMLMLQTRQSLSTTALSMSAQAAQSVLRLFA